MNSIQRRSSLGLYDYLTEGRTPELGRHASLSDYYVCAEGEAWGGGCDRLRFSYGPLEGKTLSEVGMSKDSFSRLAEGCWRSSPTEKTKLVQRQNGRHSAGVDMILAPPKSVSAELLVCGDKGNDDLLRAHQVATKRAFDELERSALVCRQPTRQWEKAPGTKTEGSPTVHVNGELIAFAATHWQSRPTAANDEHGSEADPQLHSHVFVMNVAWNPERQRFQAVDHYGILQAQDHVQAVYQTVLAHELGKLGYELEWHENRRHQRSFELAGSEAKLREFLSTRSQEVTAERRAWRTGHHRAPTEEEMAGICQAWASEGALVQALAERRGYEGNQHHTGEYPTDEEKAEIARIFADGLGRPLLPSERQMVSGLNRRPKAHSEGERPDWSSQRAAIERAGLSLPHHHRHRDPVSLRPLGEREEQVRSELVGPQGLHKESSVFRRSEVRPAIWRAAAGRLSPEEAEAFEAKFLASGELQLLQAHERQPRNDLLTSRTCKAAESQVLRRATEKASQQIREVPGEVVDRAIAAADRRIQVATDGTARIDNEQVEAIRHMCRPVAWAGIEGWAGTGKSTVGKATVDALREAGVVNKVIVVSTAGATATRSAESIGGDMARSVEGLSASVRHGLRIDEHTLVVVDEVAMMDTPRAQELVRLCDRAIVRTIGDQKQAESIGAGGWYAELDRRIGHYELKEGKRQHNPEDVAVCRDIRLGMAAQAIENLASRGRFHVEETDAQAVGRLLRDYRGFRDQGLSAAEVLVISDGSNEQLDEINELVQRQRMERGELGSAGVRIKEAGSSREETFHVGDRVTWVQNATCGHERIRNGNCGTVTHVNEAAHRVKVRLDGERPRMVEVRLPEHADAQSLRLGYSQHANRAQGGEAKVALVLPGRMTNGHSGYSMVTRAREQIHVYASNQAAGSMDPRAAIARRWSDFSDKQTALSYCSHVAGPHEPQPARRDLPGAWPLNRTSRPGEAMRHRPALRDWVQEEKERRRHRKVGPPPIGLRPPPQLMPPSRRAIRRSVQRDD